MTLAVAITAASLISAGFFWMIFFELPEMVRRQRARRD